MKNLPLSFDQCRRKFRRELFILRQADKDHSEARLFNDAKKLDNQLIAAGYELQYQSEWCRFYHEKRHTKTHQLPSVSYLEGWQTDLNFAGM